MQIAKLKPDPKMKPAIAPIDSDPAFAAAAKLRLAFLAKQERAEREIERMRLEAQFEGVSIAIDAPKWDRTRPVAMSGDPAERAKLRLAFLRDLPPYDGEVDTDPAPLEIPAPAIARGVAILQGRLVEEPDRAERIRVLRSHIRELDRAVRAQDEVISDLRAELSWRLSQRVQPFYEQQQLELFRICREMAAWTDEMKAFFAEAGMAGYELRSDILPAPRLTAPLHLGSEEQWDSQVSHFRRDLIERGLLR